MLSGGLSKYNDYCIGTMTARSHWSRTRKAGKVLVVNYDSEMVHILEVNLSHVNLEVSSAQTGAQALSQIYAEKPDVILLDSALPDMDGAEIYQYLRGSPATKQIPVIHIGADQRRKSKATRASDNPTFFITKPFNPADVVTLVLACLKQKETDGNPDSPTGLLNQIEVHEKIASLIEQKRTFAVIYITMSDLRAFNKAYGYAQGDRIIRLLADIVSEAVRLFGNADDSAGHLGDDKFVIFSTPWKARVIKQRIVADFNRRKKAQYTDEHLQRGYVAYENLSNGGGQGPIINLRTALVTNQKRTFYHHIEVIEAATEQIEYARRYPGNKVPFDLKPNTVEPPLTTDHQDAPNIYREELKALHGVLGWLDFIVSELTSPINEMKDCSVSIESIQTESLSQKQKHCLRTLRENVNRLSRVMDGLAHLTRAERLTADAVFEEVDVSDTLDWIMEQLRELVELRRIVTDIEGVKDVSHLMLQRKDFTQGLLYILRGEIQSSPPESHLTIRASETDEDFINIEITNPAHHVPPQVLATLLRGKSDAPQPETTGNELYSAALLAQGLGGKLSINSEEKRGITYTLTVPKKWQSQMREIHALQLATETSRREARAEIKNIQRLLSSLVEHVPLMLIKESLEKLSGKVQELGVLCNRSFFLTDDFNSRLESQQDRLLQQEVERTALSETILTISRETARSLHVDHLFDLASARRVTKYALTIASEFKLSESDRQAIYYAALLKDLGLTLSPQDMLEQTVTTIETARAVRAHFRPVWKALSTVPFLSPAMEFVLYDCERYGTANGPLGIKGENIPLGSRILAVASAFDSLTSGLLSKEKVVLTPKQAIQKIGDESGIRFDPDVVNAFLRVWRRKELEVAPGIP